MRNSIIHLLSVIALGLSIALANAPTSAKTVKECDAEYKANKDAIKGSGEKKKDFVEACRTGTETIPGGAATAPAAPAATPEPTAATTGVKTAKECDAEYKANKEAIKASGQRKKDFVAACRAGTETIPTGATPAAPAPSAAPTPAPTSTPAPTTAPAVPSTPAPSAAPAAPEPESRPTATTAPISASEAQAQASCPSETVVWVNTRSHVYHFKGTHNYGTTKHGTYMCEAAAKAAGDRAAENEKHP